MAQSVSCEAGERVVAHVCSLIQNSSNDYDGEFPARDLLIRTLNAGCQVHNTGRHCGRKSCDSIAVTNTGFSVTVAGACAVVHI